MSNVPISGLPAWVGPATGNELLPAVSGGVTYQFALSQLLQAVPAGYVPNTREVNTGTGLSGGGALSANLTLVLADTAVAAGSYGGANTIATFTVDAQGRLTAAGNSGVDFTGYVPDTRQVIAGTGLSGGGTLAADRTFNLANTAVTPATYGDATTIPQITVDQQGRITLAAGVAVSFAGYVPDTRQVIAGTGLSGGGTLAADRTFNLANTAVTPAAYGGAATVGTFTVDAQGRLTAAADVPIAIANTAVSGLGTASTANTGTSGNTLPFLDGANTWSGVNTIETASGDTSILILRSTSAGTTGPNLTLDQASATPAAGDRVGKLIFRGRDSGAATQDYASINGWIVDPTAASEDGALFFRTVIAGTSADRWWLGAGIYADGLTDTGAGRVNALGYDISGTSLFATANTWTALQTVSTADSFGTAVELIGTNAGAGGPTLSLYHNSASPAAVDSSTIVFQFNNSTPAKLNLGQFYGTMSDPTAGSEDFYFAWQGYVAGAPFQNFANLGPGLLVGTGTIPGLGIVNAQNGYQIAGTDLFGAARTFYGTTVGGGLLTLQTTDDTASIGPLLDFNRISASPAANDLIGGFRSLGRDSGGNLTVYSSIRTQIDDPTDGSEDAQIQFATNIAGGGANTRMVVANGVYGTGATGGDQGAGTSNWTGVYDDGVQILPIILQTMVTASGQSEIDFTGIPSTAKRITVCFSGLSLSGTDNMLIQLGDAGGPENTGYVSVSADIDASETTVSSTAGIIIKCDAAADAIHGTVIFNLMDAATFLWACQGTLASSNGTSSITTAGSKALTAVLTQVRIDTTGTNTFDAGTVNVVYE